MRSELERRMRAILRRIREHRFLPNHEIDACGSRYFIDFHLPSVALGIECHSRRWHLGRHLEDARRDRDIRSTGIESIYFTWEDVVHAPDVVESDTRQAIARRLAQLSPRLVPIRHI